jgi:hypothetical protein
MKIDFRWGIPVLRSLLGGKRFLLLTHNLERGGKERESLGGGDGGGRIVVVVIGTDWGC